MQVKSKGISNNQKQGKEYREYQRILYWCVEDDVWINVETPIVQLQS